MDTGGVDPGKTGFTEILDAGCGLQKVYKETALLPGAFLLDVEFFEVVRAHIIPDDFHIEIHGRAGGDMFL